MKKKVAPISTFLGPDAEINGTITFQGAIRLDGNVKGKICSNDGTLIVGEKAVINADIIVDTAIITGNITGSINACSRIEIHSPGRITGDIQSPIILIEAGVVFNGNCNMQSQTISLGKTANEPKKLTIT